MSEPTDDAHVLSATVKALRKKEQAELRELLGTLITAPSPARWREAKLGLVADLIYERGAEISQEIYEHERERRALDGEIWPPASTLAERFQGWASVLAGGLALLENRCKGVLDRNLTFFPAKGQDREQVIEALISCYRTHGRWPDAWTYNKWAHFARAQARITGRPDPHAPGLWQVKKTFGGDHDKGIAAAKRRLKADRDRIRGSAYEARLKKQGLL